MSNFASIHAYRSEVDEIIRFGGSTREGVVCPPFAALINAYARPRDLRLVEKLDYYNTLSKKRVIPDGTLKNSLRIDHGFWESKDTNDDLNNEIAKKFDKGYPDSNILFEDSQTAILYQDGQRLLTAPFNKDEALDELLTAYVSFEHPEVRVFKEAVERFKQDIPNIVTTLRGMIVQQGNTNAPFRERRETFLSVCRSAINPAVTADDVDEMLIQHILTEEIFLSIFSDTQLLDENSIARELKQVEATFFTGATKRGTLDQIKHYYECIKAHATKIVSHREKQTFLKVIYENFYRAYNPKGADRLGIFYTPGEIVDFMVRSTDTLLHRHFGRGLADQNVEILDPATGTGTYICEIIEHLPREVLARKYKQELHANEVAILPYYIANLNIETTYAAKMEGYAPFENICFVDTLDNIEGLNVNVQGELVGMSAENTRRIKSQNKRKISVVIGNPPYNANQQNENDNNKNRAYDHIDKRIKATYIAASTAQKTKGYDMYARFIRWASDRLAEQGIVAFICNRSFIDARHNDGFRKVAAQEFDHIYIVDTKSDVRVNPKISGTKNNVFGIQTGVAIVFFVKDKSRLAQHPCRIFYTSMADEVPRDEKLEILSAAKIETFDMERIEPDVKGNWLNQTSNDFETRLPVITKDAKAGINQEAIFSLFSLGAGTARDAWVYGETVEAVSAKIKFFCKTYESERARLGKEKGPINNSVDRVIKWTSELEAHLQRGKVLKFDKNRIVKANYRPFVKRFFYFAEIITHRRYQLPHFFGQSGALKNPSITVMGDSSGKPYFCLAIDCIPDLNFVSPASGGTQTFSFYRYDEEGNQQDNLTDWGLRQFQEHYGDKKICKLDIFHYTYAVLHHPAYRTKYEINLKREFPRLPFYEDFRKWVKWGKSLMELHLNYEQATPFALQRHDRKEPVSKQAALLPDERVQPARLLDEKPKLKPKLKADKAAGTIEVDAITTLSGIPPEAWAYQLGNRSALEWVLDQWKEHKISDPTVAEKFNTYRFADHKEQVIDLLLRVCTVSVETMKIIQLLPEKPQNQNNA